MSPAMGWTNPKICRGGIEEIDTGIKSNCEIHSDDGNAMQIMAQSF